MDALSDPVGYVRQNTDPKIVVSSVIAAIAVGGVLLLMSKSGVGPLQAVARAAGK
ncbi:hypothetical protein [Alloalcanivorax mobilis]|uniref:hypothetical protein n=1 Tax=Alloalcanivorax mobilis TaxID=2019569 RepID=UPI0012FFF125|nr:hypothetical protein [Alloalcanivorax mobilis]